MWKPTVLPLPSEGVKEANMGYEELKEKCLRAGKRYSIAVAKAEEEESFKAIKEVYSLGLCYPLFSGNPAIIEKEAAEAGITDYEILPAETDQKAAAEAVRAIKEKRADLLLKGLVSTSTLLKEVLKEKDGFVKGALLSHLAVIEKKDGSFLGITDGGMNIAPDLNQKAMILDNAVKFFQHLGIEKPKVSVLSAVETVNSDIPSTVDAAILTKMGERGSFGSCIVEGPLSLDLSINPHACDVKKLKGSDIRGDADILLVPDIVSGNLLGKSLVYMAGLHSGGLIVGASSPILLMSRADSAKEKLNALLLGMILAGGRS